ncbi:Centromere protein J, partial [Varanus komodoensis]
NACEAKVTARKSFLKCGEGTARLLKNRRNLGKKPAKTFRRVSFDCQNHFTWPSQWDMGKPLGKHPQLKRWVSSPTVLFLDDKNANCIISRDDNKRQLNNHEQSMEESHHTGGYDGEEMVNKKGFDGEEAVNEKEFEVPSQMNWSKCSQKCHGQKNNIKAKVCAKTEASWPISQEHSGREDNRSIEPKIPLQLIGDIKNSVSQVARRPMNASPNVTELQNLEITLANQEDQNHGYQVIQDVNRVKQWGNEYCVTADKNPEITVEIIPEFKKVNDQIVKAMHKPDRKQATTFANSQTRHCNGAEAANRWKENLSSESACTSSDSEDESKSHCCQYPWRPNTHRAVSTSKNMDISEADYATDEPSEAEDPSLKSSRKTRAKTFGAQELTGQQGTSSTASSSSSESSLRSRSLRYGKTLSSVRKSQFHQSQAARGRKEPETRSNLCDSELSLQPPSLTRNLVASLFPVFKSKANLEEQVQKMPMRKLEECEQEVLVHHGETSLLVQMKEEQAKAMDFLRKQISQYEAMRPQKLHPLEECKSGKSLKQQKEEIQFEKYPKIIKEEGESQEIQKLKQQIAGLQEEFRRNETHWHVAHVELRSQVEALTKHNLELQDELKVSEHQKMEAEGKHGAMDAVIRKTGTPALTAFLRGTSSEETLEERPVQASHKSPDNMNLGRRTVLDELTARDRNAQALSHNPQQRHVSRSLLSASNLTELKDTSPSLYVAGTYSSTSGSSEDAAFLTTQNNDILSSATLSNSRTQLSPLKPILSRRAPLYTESKEDGDVKEKIEYPDGKVKQLFTDGRRIITYPNGTKMEISTDRKTTVITFYNGDVKKILPDQRVIYYYADAQTTRTIHPDGLEVLQFPNNQIEKYHPDGTEEIVFPDQTVKRRYDGGLEETVFPDGTVVKVEKNGVKTIQFRNGQTEIHTALSTRREYPDGTVKTVYANRGQETNYSSGRVRIKDEKGTPMPDKK